MVDLLEKSSTETNRIYRFAARCDPTNHDLVRRDHLTEMYLCTFSIASEPKNGETLKLLIYPSA